MCAQRPRLPRGPPRSTLRRWRRARPGSGWFGVESTPLSATRTPHPQPTSSLHASAPTIQCRAGLPPPKDVRCQGLASAMRAAQLRSVTRRPPAASLPGHLPGALLPYGMGRLILGQASRLDAVSGYPCRTWLPSAAGRPTTGTPAVRPARSSRTRASPPQPSRARGG